MVRVIIDFRPDRDTKFIFGGGLAWLVKKMANVGSDRENGKGAYNHRISNGSKY